MSQIGFELPVYYNSGTTALPVWDEFTLAVELTTNQTRSEVDMSTKGSNWNKYRGGMIALGLNLTAISDRTDAIVNALHAAFYNRSVVELAFSCTGSITTPGVKYVRAQMEVFDITKPEPLNDKAVNNYLLRPSILATADPVEVTVPTP